MSKSEIRRICLYGGPGCGKSVTAAGLYHNISRLGYEVELVREFIKEEMVYRGLHPQNFDQMWILGNQMHREEKALRHSKLIVTDSPLLVCAAYAVINGQPCADEMIRAALKFEEEYPSLNIFLSREGVPYKTGGRYQDHEAAIDIDSRILDTLDGNQIPYVHCLTVNFVQTLEMIRSVLNGQDS